MDFSKLSFAWLEGKAGPLPKPIRLLLISVSLLYISLSVMAEGDQQAAGDVTIRPKENLTLGVRPPQESGSPPSEITEDDLSLIIENTEVKARLDNWRRAAEGVAPDYLLTLVFPRETSGERDAWRTLGREVDSLSRAPKVAIALVGENGDPWKVYVKTGATWERRSIAVLEYLSAGEFVLWAFVTALLIAIIGVGVRTFLRDKPVVGSGHAYRAVSLSLVQAAVWLFVIASAAFYVWLATGSTHFPASVLSLLGISLTTTGISKYVRQSDKKSGVDRNSFVTTLGGMLDAGDGEPALTRVQLVVWNVIVVIVFVALVAQERLLPDLSQTLLALVGISGGTYVGPKAFRRLLERRRLSADAGGAAPPSSTYREPPVSEILPGAKAVEDTTTATLRFDGYKLYWERSSPAEWEAFSGLADESARESEKNRGPIPQGKFAIDPKNIENMEPSDYPAWGKRRVKIEPYKATVKRMRDCFPELRSGFYVHGGQSKGTIGCIELIDDADENAFFGKLAEYGKKIELEVKYTGEREDKYEEPKCPY